MIPVTRSFLPPLDEYVKHVSRAFENGWLTNRGELVLELESELSTFLGLKDTKILCLNNGTSPLQIALKLLARGGEVITTPFSYVATTTAILWENCTPVFVDIHPEFLTIDETKIEEAITENTTCILATHVFGNPCNIEVIEQIAQKYNLKVIYDGAHAFGVEYKGASIFEFGDITTCSFHATKIFHTGEGGAIFCKDRELFDKIFLSHAFGHNADNFLQIGINAKMSELQAAMGLSVLPFVKDIILKKRENFYVYQNLLNDNFFLYKLRENVVHNYSYFPIFFESENKLLNYLDEFNRCKIFPRRYFYPSLNTLEYLPNYTRCPISEAISKRILCLPNYHDLMAQDQARICKILEK